MHVVYHILKSATLPEDVAQAKVHDLDIIVLVQEKVLGPPQVRKGSRLTGSVNFGGDAE